jgi:hypothetical protein
MPPRKAIPLKTKLAAALRNRLIEKDGKLVPYEQLKRMTDDDVISKFEFDHDVHFAIGGTCQHWNLTPRLKAEHRQKTAKQDIPQIAKTKRLEKATEEFRRKLLAKSGAETAETDKKRKPTSKIQSRGFQQWRNFKGEIVKRGKP